MCASAACCRAASVCRACMCDAGLGISVPSDTPHKRHIYIDMCIYTHTNNRQGYRSVGVVCVHTDVARESHSCLRGISV